MAVALTLATLDDAPTLARCNVEASQSDALHQAASGLSANATLGQQQAALKWREGLFKRNLSKPNVHWMKAMDESTGAIVGYAGWMGPEDPGAKKVKYDVRDLDPMPATLYREAKIAEIKKRVLGGRDDVWYTPAYLIRPPWATYQ